MDATRASLASNEAVVDPSAKAGDKAQAKTGAPVPKAATAHHAAASATPSATVCAHCGVIEGVREVKQKGKGTGVGVVAGGVVGGALGNQVGKGSGRTVMTVLGAIGGGLAGNEIEKRARSETAYEVRVRMDDGSLRTLQQKTAPKAGTRVTIEGNALHTVHAPAAQSPTLRPSAGT
jgi:outer membrane lipoprotein SlyB